MIPPLTTIDHIHVFVADRHAAEKWYTRVLGLKPITYLSAWAVDGGPLTLGNAEGTVHLALFERPVETCRSTIAFSVPASHFAEWQAHLSKVLESDLTPVDHSVSWSLYFTDPDGNPYEITTYDYQEIAEHVQGEEP